MMYNETCEKCETTGNEYLISGQYCISCAEEEIARLQTELDKHRWVPVSERLPEKSGQVWIYYKNTGYTYQAYCDPRYNKWGIFDPSGGFSDVDCDSPPTHWKPIILPI